MPSHPSSLNRNERRIRFMTMAARLRNEIWLNTAVTQYQYTVDESQSKLPSTIILMPTPITTLPKRTKKYLTHLSLCGKNSNDAPPHKQQKIAHTPLVVGQDEPIEPLISSRTQLGTKHQKTANTLLSKEPVGPITPPIASRTQSSITTVPRKVRI